MTRNPIIDIAKGITILLVIVGHQSGVPWIINKSIFTFYMPLFFFISGLLFKKNDVKVQIVSDAKRLLLPYFLTCVVFVVWWMVCYLVWSNPWMIKEKLISVFYGSGSMHESPLLGDMPMLGAIWFLLALFWCRLGYRFLCCGNNKCINGLFAVSVAIIATLIDVYVINLPFSILPGLSALLFFWIGNIFLRHKGRLLKCKNALSIVGLVCSALAIMYSHLYMVDCSYGFYPLDIVAGCFGIYVIYRVSVFVNKTFLSNFFVLLGLNSITILCLHFLELHSGVWDVLNIRYPWYFMLPIKFVSIGFCVVVLYFIPLARKVYRIKRLPV